MALPGEIRAAADAQNRPLPTQTINGQVYAEVSVPACGWTTLTGAQAPASLPNTLSASPTGLENELLRLEINARGELTSIYDKEIGLELAAAPCNTFRMYRDQPNWFDAWDIDSNYELMPVDLPETAEIKVTAAGPLTAQLQVTRKLNNSTLTQTIRLPRGSRRVEFVTSIDWNEKHKLLKVCFPVNIHANEALHEIQFGHIARPNHRSRPYDASRFEVSNHKWSALVEGKRGFSVLNDSKYGLNVLDNSINLTLLKSAQAPDPTADQGVQTFTYAFYAWNGSLADSDVVHQAYEVNVPVLTARGAAGEQSLFNLDEQNIIIDTVKPAEDGSGDCIVRLYESKQVLTRATLATSLPFQSAVETDMLENKQKDLVFAANQLHLEFRPFEIKTIRFH